MFIKNNFGTFFNFASVRACAYNEKNIARRPLGNDSSSFPDVKKINECWYQHKYTHKSIRNFSQETIINQSPLHWPSPPFRHVPPLSLSPLFYILYPSPFRIRKKRVPFDSDPCYSTHLMQKNPAAITVYNYIYVYKYI